jgi:6-phosphogluconate dehydrogenase
MVHNGIEYAEMQLLAELYATLRPSMDYAEIAEEFSEWNRGDLSSYLLEITIKIFQKKDGNNYVLDRILDNAGNKGTGSWASKSALDMGIPTTMMASAVFARFLSSFKEKRTALSKLSKSAVAPSVKPDLKVLKSAYRFARIINHHQGFELIRIASESNKWNINLSEVARIWTNGCIIRSGFMTEASEIFKKTDALTDSSKIQTLLNSEEASIVDMIKFGLSTRTALDSFWSAYNYWISMTSENLPANLIQAQRDCFGAHRYQRNDLDSSEFYHTNWEKE